MAQEKHMTVGQLKAALQGVDDSELITIAIYQHNKTEYKEVPLYSTLHNHNYEVWVRKTAHAGVQIRVHLPAPAYISKWPKQ